MLQHCCRTEEDICQVKEIQAASKASLTGFFSGWFGWFLLLPVAVRIRLSFGISVDTRNLSITSFSIQQVKKWDECLCCHFIHLHHSYKVQVLLSSFCANDWKAYTTVNGTDFAAETKPLTLFAVLEQRAGVYSLCFHDEKKKNLCWIFFFFLQYMLYLNPIKIASIHRNEVTQQNSTLLL